MGGHSGRSTPAISRPIVDRELCMGSGQCSVYAPNSFALDAEFKARVIDPTGDPPDIIRSAVQACPTSALAIVAD